MLSLENKKRIIFFAISDKAKKPVLIINRRVQQYPDGLSYIKNVPLTEYASMK